MERRQHHRVRLPMLVDVSHPSLGTIAATARDISESGVFVRLSNTTLRPGAKVKVTLKNLLDEDNQPTPTVQMEVKRSGDDGVGLEFTNLTGRHLWGTVQRLREELAIGRDYFQVYQAAAVVHPERGVLVVQQNGKWLLPGCYLVVGERWQDAIDAFASHALGISDLTLHGQLGIDSEFNPDTPEAATLRLVHLARTETADVALADDAPFREFRWLAHGREIEVLTFSSAYQRNLTHRALDVSRGDGVIE